MTEQLNYSIRSPISTHFTTVTCKQYMCTAYEQGWVTKIDESTVLGKNQAEYIRLRSGRKFTVTRDEDGLTRFTFSPGQTCFTEHKMTLNRPEIYSVIGNHGTKRTHTKPQFWLEDFNENMGIIKEVQERG